jgi:hypothetical protein
MIPDMDYDHTEEIPILQIYHHQLYIHITQTKTNIRTEKPPKAYIIN